MLPGRLPGCTSRRLSLPRVMSIRSMLLFSRNPVLPATTPQPKPAPRVWVMGATVPSESAAEKWVVSPLV